MNPLLQFQSLLQCGASALFPSAYCGRMSTQKRVKRTVWQFRACHWAIIYSGVVSDLLQMMETCLKCVQQRQPWAFCVFSLGGSGSSLGAHCSISLCSCFAGVTQSSREVEGCVTSEGHSLLHLKCQGRDVISIAGIREVGKRWLMAVSAET